MPEVFNAKKKLPVKTEINHTHSLIHPLTTFMVRPNGVHFETQTKDEEIILFLRQHFVVNIGWIIATIILAILPLVAIPLMLGTEIVSLIPRSYYVVFPIIWYVGVFGYVLVNFIHWYFNVYIVTNERIVDIDWVNLLYKKFSSTNLGNIQDVSYKQGGLLELFFDFGNVYIQTAGSEQNFEFVAVPKADEVVLQINELTDKEHKKI